MGFNAGDHEAVVIIIMLSLRSNVHYSYIATETNYRLGISDYFRVIVLHIILVLHK